MTGRAPHHKGRISRNSPSQKSPFCFRRGSLPLVRRILSLIDSGFYPKRIAASLNVPYHRIKYYVNRLEQAGYIRCEVRSSATFYSLTDKGRELLEKLSLHEKGEKGEFGSPGVSGCGGFSPLCGWVGGLGVRVHNVCFKGEVLKWGSGFLEDCFEVRLRNWVKRVGCVGVVRVEVTSRHVLFRVPDFMCDDPYRGLLEAYEAACAAAAILEERSGMKIGRLEICGKPHFGVYWDPVAKHLADRFVLSDDVGAIDKSKGRAELDLYDPRLAKMYLTMPLEIQGMKQQLASIIDILSKTVNYLGEYSEAMKMHLKVVDALREASSAVNEASRRLEELLKTVSTKWVKFY